MEEELATGAKCSESTVYTGTDHGPPGGQARCALTLQEDALQGCLLRMGCGHSCQVPTLAKPSWILDKGERRVTRESWDHRDDGSSSSRGHTDLGKR